MTSPRFASDHTSDLSRSDGIAQVTALRHVAHVCPQLYLPSRPACRFKHRFRLLNRQGKGLFAQHRSPPLHRRNGNLGVGVWHGSNDCEVKIPRIQCLAVIISGARPWPGGGSLGQALRAGVAQSRDLDQLRPQPLQDLRMVRPPAARSRSGRRVPDVQGGSQSCSCPPRCSKPNRTDCSGNRKVPLTSCDAVIHPDGGDMEQNQLTCPV